MLAREFPAERAREQVLFQSRGGPLAGAEYRAVVDAGAEAGAADLRPRLTAAPWRRAAIACDGP